MLPIDLNRAKKILVVGALQAMEDGFSSVMFDGSHYGIEENIEKTKEIIRIANEKGISVEAEVGAIGGEEDVSSRCF